MLASVLGELNERGITDVHLIDVGTSMGLNLYPDFTGSMTTMVTA